MSSELLSKAAPTPEPAANILLVDDSPANLRVLEAVLRRPGHNLVTARSAEEALKQLLDREFALVLMDVQMPQMDGFDAISLIRSREQTKHVPVILMTAMDRSDIEMFKGYSLGVVDFLFKPIVPDILRTKVNVFVELFRKTELLKRQNQSELAALKHQYELVLDSVGEGLYGLDRSGRITFVNPAGAALLGFTVKALVGELLHEIAHFTRADGALHPLEECPIHRTLADGATRRLEHNTVWGRGGAPVPVEYMVNAIYENNRIVGAVIAARDVSEERQLQEQLRRSQKLDAIGQLAGGIAHDFNNLITVILGRSEMARRKLTSDNALYRDLALMENAAERAAGLTRQLLAFSRRQILQPRVVDLNHLIVDINQLLRRLIREDIEIVTSLSPALGRIKVDPGQMEQVIVNLAVNARDAMPRGGKVTIETGNANLDQKFAAQHVEAAPGSYVMLAVSDTGCGMDAQIQQRIFEPFFTTKEAGKGTGLGLSTVYGIVKQSGGHIWVYSEVGRGTTFKIYLPRVDDPLHPVLAPLTESEEAEGGSETILLVEDDDSIRALAEEILRNAGYTVISAAGGAQAIAKAEKHGRKIDLLVSDVVMPKMRGSELAIQLKEIQPQLKVLFISGYTESAVVDHGLEASAQFLQKPFAADAFARKVREVLNDK